MSDLATLIHRLRGEAESLIGAPGLFEALRPAPAQDLTAMSVIIPSRNEGMRVERTVRSLVFRRSWAFPLEIVVVDDASTDHSCDRLPKIATESTGVTINVHRLDRWSGIPSARNRGAEMAHNPIFVITDANTVYPQNWDVPIRRHFHVSRLLAGTIADEQTGHCGYGLSLELPSMGVTWVSDPSRYGGYAPVAASTCTVISRRLFEQLGGYDETLPLYGAAEPELSVRAWLSGADVVLLPDLVVAHRFRPANERLIFYERYKSILLKSNLRFACSYLPELLLEPALGYFSSLMGPSFRHCIAELEREGIWGRRVDLRRLLHHDFSWLVRRFNLAESTHSLHSQRDRKDASHRRVPAFRPAVLAS